LEECALRGGGRAANNHHHEEQKKAPARREWVSLKGPKCAKRKAKTEVSDQRGPPSSAR